MGQMANVLQPSTARRRWNRRSPPEAAVASGLTVEQVLRRTGFRTLTTHSESKMPRILYALFGALFLAAAPAAMAQTTDTGTADTGTAANTPPQTQLKATHGDWQVLCDQGQTSGDACFMVQTVDVQQTGKRILAAAILKSQDGNAVMRITVPLGVLLPKGLALGIDGTEVGQIGFVACFAEGCMTQVQLKPEVLAQLKAGSKAVVTVYDIDSKAAELPLSLSGFTAAFGDF